MLLDVTDAQLIAIVKFLVQLRAENLAMRRALQQRGGPGDAGMDSLIEEQQRRLANLPVVANALQRADVSLLPILLDTLSRVRLE